MNGSIPADATEIGRRRADSGCGGCGGAAREAAESGKTAGEARVSLTAPPVSSPCTSGSGNGKATAAHAHTAAETRGVPSAKSVRH